MRRHERPESLDVHVEKKIMLEIISMHGNETTKKLLCMRKHASMLYHAMPWRAHVVDFLRNASERTFTMLNTTTINVSRKIITNINAFK